MAPRSRIRIFFFLCLGLMGSLGAAEPVRFSRDILPVLSDRCFACHGPDETQRQADLRLDTPASVGELRGASAVIVPGDPRRSELMRRIASHDSDLQMPPPESGRSPLTKAEWTLFQQWIKAGAPWGQHWAFEKPVRPLVTDEDSHPIDYFIDRRLKLERLRRSPEAERSKLIRRLSLDLTGLPPTREETAAFVGDETADAYDKLVDRLLSSPHYGERMAMWWLDAARYSDTDGYQGDATRSNWPWRDWVIQAFTNRMPFDQFTIEQFAGDLLPDATAEQILATCFHRNHMTNGEGGRHPEESRIDYVIDRVNTTGTVWLGMTLGCAQCHSHKFDPISQNDYYSLFAFFDSIDEDGKAGGGAKPYLKYTSPFADRAVAESQELVNHRKPVADTARMAAETEFDVWLVQQIAAVKSGFQPWHVLQPTAIASVEGTLFQQEDEGVIQTRGPYPRQDDYHITAASPVTRITGLRLEVFPHASHTAGKLSRGTRGEFILTDVKLQVIRDGDTQVRDIELASAIADAEVNVGGRNYGRVSGTLDDDPRNGWTTDSHDPLKPHVAVFALAEPLKLAPDEELRFVMLHRSTVGDANTGRFRIAVSDQPGTAVRSFAEMPMARLATAGIDRPEDLDPAIHKALREQFLFDHAEYQKAKRSLDRANQQLAAVKRGAGAQNVMVLAQRKTLRKSYVLERGVWDKKGMEVQTAVPTSILETPGELTRTRLDLANWLVSDENPLTARVIVNQLWQLCFGAGLVRTPEDFGRQGELPTHPDLLDWLAVELMENNWDLQHIQRLMVRSQTYRQSSRVTPAAIERDPENRLLARGARFRMPSWMIRDAALGSSGLLNPAIGGPTVMPYQPDGVWAEMFMGRFRYQPSQGAAQYRRTLYAFWRRSAAPTFLFDSSQRRVCEVRPRHTNTPLQALTMLNDLNILAAARHLARTALAEDDDPQIRLQFIFESVLSRPPTDRELEMLTSEWTQAAEYYRNAGNSARQLLDFGQPEQRRTDQPRELAALMIVASIVYNLDEAITHE